MKNIFKKAVADEVISRVNQLTPDTQPSWGKMSVGQMLAHLNVAYEFVYDNKHDSTKAKGVKKFLLKVFVKNMVVSEKPYPKNGRTALNF